MPLELPCVDIQRSSFTAQSLNKRKFPELCHKKLMLDFLVVVPELLKCKQGISLVNHSVIQISGIKVPRMDYSYQSVQCQKSRQ